MKFFRRVLASILVCVFAVAGSSPVFAAEQNASAAAVTNAAVHISYNTHVQTYGWLDWAQNGATSGTTGQAKRLEAIQIKTSAPATEGGIRYRTHVQTYGWLDWAENGATSGTTGQAKRLEAIQIELTGNLASQYDVYYRTHVQTYGWLGWAKNGAPSGSAGYAKRLESIQIVLVPKGGAAPGSTADAYRELAPSVKYSTYLSGTWQGTVSDNALSGSVGNAVPIEAMRISLQKGANSLGDSSIEYRTHLQTYGWQNWASNGAISGKPGSGKRIEAIQIRLKGALASEYDIYYRTHVQTYGWLDWACNGQPAGTAGYAKRIEALQVVLVKKGGAAPGNTAVPYRELPASVIYQTYISNKWLSNTANGASNGITNQGKISEGIRVSLKPGAQALDGSSVSYRTYLQTYGWQNWVSNGATSGKVGSGKRMEAIQITLTGPAVYEYDIYYRSYVSGFGWLGWAKNGEYSGTADYAKAIEAVQIQLVEDGGAAPGSTENAFREYVPSTPMQVTFSASGLSNFGGLLSIEPNKNVTLTAEASGGAGTYSYRYRAELIGGAAQTIQDYTTSSSCTWSAKVPGRYKMHVDVKDAGGTVKTASFQMSVGYSGIDVSVWQGAVDWNKVKAAGIDFAIIRASFGWEDADSQTDKQLVRNVQMAKQAGLPFGLYHYSYADTVEQAKQEAYMLLEILQKNEITPADVTYPIAFDIEELDRLSVSQKRLNTDMINAFCNIIRDAGYLPMVYASKATIQSYMYYDEIKANNIWMAAWTSTPNDTSIFDDCPSIDLWQYSDVGTVDGIDGAVDLNICYVTSFKTGGQISSGDTNSSTPVSQQGKIVSVDTGSYLNIRQAPSTSAAVIGKLQGGDIVTILSETSGWYQITTSGGITGYVLATYVQKL